MAEAINHISAISLFVDDLARSKTFYTNLFSAKVVFEDATSTALKFENLIINLLVTSEAGELVAPRAVGKSSDGKRFQMSIWVKDLDNVLEGLKANNVQLLVGPELKPWGMRVVTFEDPDGNNWEIAQEVK